MPNWIPNKKEKQFLDTIAAMTIDCQMGKGTVNKETYTSNLRVMSDLLDDIRDEEKELNYDQKIKLFD